VDELEYPELVRRCLADIGLRADDEELSRFLAAEHAASSSATTSTAMSPALPRSG
jgi:hypothetical protein